MIIPSSTLTLTLTLISQFRYVRASNLWEEITSYYKRKTLAQLNKDMAKSDLTSTTTTTTPGGRASTSRNGGGSRTSTPWWKSESLHRALSVAAMIIVMVLFKRAGKG